METIMICLFSDSTCTVFVYRWYTDVCSYLSEELSFSSLVVEKYKSPHDPIDNIEIQHFSHYGRLFP